MSTISPNMNLIVPSVGSTPGPDWASELNNSLTLVDQHDHTPGKGVPITPSGISINAALAFNGNDANTLRATKFTSQASALPSTDVTALYVSGGNLYYNNSAGTAVPITNGASVAGSTGTITGLPSGTASAAYSVGVFTWQAATNTPASMDQGPTTIREAIASGNGVTLTTVNALSNNYTLVLPEIPVSQKIMTLDSSGNITAPYSVDGSTIQISSNVIMVGSLSIGTAQITNGSITLVKMASNSVDTAQLVNGSVTNPKLGAGSVSPDKMAAAVLAVAQSTGAVTALSGTTPYSVTITGSSRPVMAVITVTGNSPGLTGSVGPNPKGLVLFKNGVAQQIVMSATGGGTTTFFSSTIYDSGGAGSLNYQLLCSSADGAGATLTPVGTLTLTVYQL